MSRTKPPPPAPPCSPWASALAGGAALVLLADLPGVFTRGDLLRGALLPLLALGALVVGCRTSGAFARQDRAPLALLALPLLLCLTGALAITRPALATPAALARSLGPWIALSALALGAWRLLRGPRELLRLWRALLLAAAGAAAWLYVEVLVSGTGAGPFGRPGVSGPLLGALLGPAWLLPWTSKPLHRAPVLALLAAGCAFSGSRTGWATGALSLLLALALRPLPPAAPALVRGLRRAAGPVLLVGGLVAGLLLAGVLPGGGPTLEVRRGVWRASAALVAEKPLLGHGLGAFRAQVLRARDPEEARLSRGREPFMAHNDVLHVAVEGGLPAALLLTLFGIASLGLAWRAWRRHGHDPFAAAALCVLAAQGAASLAEQVLPDPAHVLLGALALATALARRAPPEPGSAARGTRVLVGLLALLLLAAAALRARDVMADRHLRAFRDALAEGLTLERLAQTTEGRLVAGALRWRPDHAEALYRRGVSEAEQGRYGAAREAWRRALEVEPALTEARLDMAQAYALEGRREDAQATLAEARRLDPTRYDLVLRQGHVALGPEPVLGGGARDGGLGFDPLEPLRRYNEAQALDPERFETQVAFARVARRLGDLESAGDHLRRAEALAGPMGEVLFEAFHLAEVEGRADERVLASILTLALGTDVGLAGSVRREALAHEEAAIEREREARAEALLDNPRWKGVDLAWSGFTVRALALLTAGLVLPDALVREARALTEAGDHRAALARHRALLAWIGDQVPGDPAARVAFYERRGNLLVEAAQSASRFDGALARTFYAEGHLLKGLEFLERGLLAEARRVLELAVEDGPTDARPCVALARARARAGDLDGAEAALLQALARDPAVAARLPGEPDLAQVLPRERIRAALPR